MRARVRLQHSADAGWHIDLPTYTMIPDSFLPLIPGKIHKNGVTATTNPADPALNAMTVEVECPDNYAHPVTGKIDNPRIRAIYNGNPKWDRPDYIPPD